MRDRPLLLFINRGLSPIIVLRCSIFVRPLTRTSYIHVVVPIDSGRPAFRPLGQHCETMLFKIIPDDFVSNRGVQIGFLENNK